MESEFGTLEHHGVKGMRWGQRRKASVKTSTDHRNARKLQAKGPAALSDKQLKDLNSRLNLEQNYSRLNPNKVLSGKQKVELLLGTVGVGVSAYNTLHSPAGKAGVAAVKKILEGKSGYTPLHLAK